ncbi:MAG: hypothetical protein R3F44_15005 [Candidatus Competibacteraceae bacterium]
MRKKSIGRVAVVNMLANSLGRDQHFDPDIVDAFLECAEQFRTIAARFADDEQVWRHTLEQVETALSDETIVLGGDTGAR